MSVNPVSRAEKRVTGMKIYVDFDDCLSESGRFFAGLASELFGKNVPYEAMRFFNMQQSFGLTDEEYDRLLAVGHEPERLLSYRETPGASAVINEWMEKGYDVSVITGRPFSAYEASRAWLDGHGLEKVRLFCLDKYGRENFIKGSVFNLTLDDYRGMKFDYAVEDSPAAFRFFNHLPQLKVMVFDRPWNRACTFPGGNYCRVYDWRRIRANVTE